MKQIYSTLVMTSARKPLITLLAGLLLAMASLFYAATELGIVTSTSAMISSEVPFRKHRLAFKQDYPALSDPVVLIIKGKNAELTEQALDRAVILFEDAKETVFGQINAPGTEAYFQRNGLLFLSEDELEDLSLQLSEAQPFIAALNSDPSLRGLSDVLGLALDALSQGEEQAGRIAAPMQEIATVLQSHVSGEKSNLSWRDLMGGQGGESTASAAQRDFETQRFLLALVGENKKIAVHQAEDIKLQLQQEFGDEVTFTLTGEPVLDIAELRSVRDGATMAGTLSFVLVAILLIWGLRSWRAVIAVLIPLALGLCWTLGFATLAIGHLNLISVTFAVLFIGLSVDFGIHFVLRYVEACRSDEDHNDALAIASTSTGPALGLAALCAAIAFFAFMPTDYLGLAELGVIAGGSMGFALVGNLTIAPALMSLLRPKFSQKTPDHRLAAKIAGAGRIILSITLLASLAAAATIPHLQFDFNPLNLQDPNSPPVAAYFALAEDVKTTPYSLSVTTPDSETALALAAKLKALPESGRVLTLHSYIPKDQADKLAILEDLSWTLDAALNPIDIADPPSLEQQKLALENLYQKAGKARDSLSQKESPQNTDLLDSIDQLQAALNGFSFFLQAAEDEAAALKDLDDAVTGELPDYLDKLEQAMLASHVGLKDIPDSIRTRWVTQDGRYRVEVSPATAITGNDEFKAFSDAVREVAPNATGGPITITEAGRTVAGAFIEATSITAIGILLVLIIVMRRFDDMLMTLAPLVLAGMLTLAATVWLNIPLNFANIIVLPLLLGLGVASSIHMVSRWRLARESDEAFTNPLATSTARAVLFSALTTAASFGSLAVSPHRGMASMGFLLTIAIVVTLTCTLLVLPAAIERIQRARTKTQ